MKVLIAGCGYVGSELAEQLATKGDEVFTLSRSARKIPNTTNLKADLNEFDTLSCIPSGLEAVYYVASADSRDEEAYKDAYIRGLQTLLQVLRRKAEGGALSDVRLLYVSSTGVYGQDDGSWVDEDSETEPTNFTGQILLEAEAVALNSGCNTSIVRFSGIYGPGRTWMLKQVHSGQAACYFGLPQYSNRVHLEDCAGSLAHIASLDSPEEVYLISDDEPTARTQFLFWLAAQLSAPEPQMKPLESASARTLATNKRCKNQRIKDSGYEFAYPDFRAGYTPLIAEFLRD